MNLYFRSLSDHCSNETFLLLVYLILILGLLKNNLDMKSIEKEQEVSPRYLTGPLRERRDPCFNTFPIYSISSSPPDISHWLVVRCYHNSWSVLLQTETTLAISPGDLWPPRGSPGLAPPSEEPVAGQRWRPARRIPITEEVRLRLRPSRGLERLVKLNKSSWLPGRQNWRNHSQVVSGGDLRVLPIRKNWNQNQHRSLTSVSTPKAWSLLVWMFHRIERRQRELRIKKFKWKQKSRPLRQEFSGGRDPMQTWPNKSTREWKNLIFNLSSRI